MITPIGNLCAAIVGAWGTYELDAAFKAYWAAADRTKFTPLNDHEAEGAHPHPYCVFDVSKPTINARSSAAGLGSGNRHIEDVPVEFTVYARDIAGGSSAKEVAENLAGQIMAIYGGHPVTAPRIDGYSMTYGGVLIFRYDANYGMKVDINNYKWIINYLARIDVPVA